MHTRAYHTLGFRNLLLSLTLTWGKFQKMEKGHRRRRKISSLALSVPEFFTALLIQIGDNGFALDWCHLFEFEDKHGNDIDEYDV
jgi:hypothetical protein